MVDSTHMNPTSTVSDGKVRFYALQNKFRLLTLKINASSASTTSILTKEITFTITCVTSGSGPLVIDE